MDAIADHLQAVAEGQGGRGVEKPKSEGQTLLRQGGERVTEVRPHERLPPDLLTMFANLRRKTTPRPHLDAHFLSAKYFLPAMRTKKWGRFIGISSNMVGLAIPGMSHYIATKMGIIGFMRGLANDVASDGITSNAVLPGLTNTLAIAPQSEEQRRATWEQQAIKRLGEPEDITGAILFLTSDDAAFITGQAIVVDGGQYRIG